MTFIKCLMEPIQHSAEKPQNPPVCPEKKQGYTSGTQCSCLDGLGKACSHIAALLFAVESATQLEANAAPSSLSVKCIWNNYYKSKVILTVASQLDLSHPR